MNIIINSRGSKNYKVRLEGSHKLSIPILIRRSELEIDNVIYNNNDKITLDDKIWFKIDVSSSDNFVRYFFTNKPNNFE